MAAEEKEKVRGLKVLLWTDKGWFLVELTEEKKKAIFRILDKEKIKLLKP